MDIVAILTQGLLGGLAQVMNFVTDKLGYNGLLGLLIGIILMTIFNQMRANIFKVLIIAIAIVIVIGLTYQSSNPDASIALPSFNQLINTSGQYLNQTNVTGLT